MVQVAKYYRIKKKKNLLYFIIFTLAVKHLGNSVWLKTTLTWSSRMYQEHFINTTFVEATRGS